MVRTHIKVLFHFQYSNSRSFKGEGTRERSYVIIKKNINYKAINISAYIKEAMVACFHNRSHRINNSNNNDV